MFSKVLVKLTGVFLIIFTSVTSATPSSAGKVQNTTEALTLRADDLRRPPPPHYDPHGCTSPYVYYRRECNGNMRLWEDVCGFRGMGRLPDGRHVQTTVYNNKTGMCDKNNYCLDTWAEGEKRGIICVPIQDSTGTGPTDPLTGTSNPMGAVKKWGVSQLHFELTVTHAMIGASVSAVFISECRSSLSCVICFFAHLGIQLNLGNEGTYIVTPHNVIIAHLRGHQTALCSGDGKHPEQCYPGSARDFKVGDIIDFTWGMSELQIGGLVFAVVPSGKL